MSSTSFRSTRSSSSFFRRALAPLAGALMLGVAACSDTSTGLVGDGGQGSLSIHLTDAPGDFVKAVVTVSEIYLQGEGGRVVLSDEPMTTDLLELVNSTKEIVPDAAVPEGNYRELRFVITGAYIEVETADGGSQIFATSDDYDGLPADAEVAGTLVTPSFSSSGLKVKLPSGGITIGSEPVALLVDFDVGQSFGRQAGNSGRWVMSPVIRATELESAGVAVARVQLASPAPTMPDVSGTPLGLGDLTAVLTNAEGSVETVKLTDSNSDGIFEARFVALIDGTYTLDLKGVAGVSLTTSPTRPAQVVIAEGAEVATLFTLNAATYTAPAPAP